MRVKCDGLGFGNNPLFTQRCNYAYQYYLLHNSKLIDEKLDKIMFNRQMNVELTLKMLLEFLKSKWKILHCINERVD